MQQFDYSITNWLSFYWKGFKQTTKYTYVIEDISDIDKVYNDFEHAKRKNIKKANSIIEVKYDISSEEFYQNHKLTLAKQGDVIEYSYDTFKKIYDVSYKNNSGKTIYAIDSNNNIHCALFIVWDDNSAYDLISTIDIDYRNSGAASLLVFEAIKYVSNYTKKFDFEGSMIESVEKSFRQFGSEQKPYFRIYKDYSTIFKLSKLIKAILG